MKGSLWKVQLHSMQSGVLNKADDLVRWRSPKIQGAHTSQTLRDRLPIQCPVLSFHTLQQRQPFPHRKQVLIKGTMLM